MKINIEDFNNLIGKNINEASFLLGEQGMKLRVVEKDGEPFFLTMEYRFGRINVVIENDLITKIESIG